MLHFWGSGGCSDRNLAVFVVSAEVMKLIILWSWKSGVMPPWAYCMGVYLDLINENHDVYTNLVKLEIRNHFQIF